MNLLKKNKFGIKLIDYNLIQYINKDTFNLFTKKAYNFTVHKEMLDFKCQKIIRISDSIYELSQIISIESIKKNIDAIDLKFTDIAILMPSDKIGIVFIKKVGGDIFFIWLYNLGLDTRDINAEINAEINIYNFFTKEFIMEEKEQSVILIKILTYLFYGEVSEKICKPNHKVMQNHFEYIKNESKKEIWFANSLWKTKISLIGDFKVSGHFRLQPIGENRSQKKLIFIEEFVKHGYNRDASVTNFNNT